MCTKAYSYFSQAPSSVKSSTRLVQTSPQISVSLTQTQNKRLIKSIKFLSSWSTISQWTIAVSQFSSQTDVISKPEETPSLTDRMLQTKDKKSLRSLLSEREETLYCSWGNEYLQLTEIYTWDWCDMFSQKKPPYTRTHGLKSYIKCF